jgi:hypothetical protein
LARIGSDSLLVRYVRLPLGELPWQPRKYLGIRIRFGDLAKVLAEETMPDLEPVEV